MTKAQGEVLLKAARLAIHSKLYAKPIPKVQGLEKINMKQGIFVTIHKDKILRGCIGRISSEDELHSAVLTTAISAAFEDPRFPSLKKEEYPDIELEITVLSSLFPVNSIDDIEIGRDGLLLTRGHHSSVFLPQVPVEQNWDLNTYLSHLCLKAGLKKDCWRHGDSKLFRFTGMVFKEND